MFERSGKGRVFKVILTTLFACLLVAMVIFFIATGYVMRNAPEDLTQQGDQGGGGGVPAPQLIGTRQGGNDPTAQAQVSSISTVARTATPGVVGVSVLRVDSKSLFDRNSEDKWGVGSGVIVSSNGYILTNHHVAGGKSKRIVVSLQDGRNVDGITVWGDPVLDLAVVKVNLTNLTTIPVGDANGLQVGEPAIAIGNPLGLQFQRTVTSGIISALNRTIKIDTDQGSNYMEDLIQTDASINPGNSGGPLLNLKGQVVGINTIKVTSAEAIGFAIPINVAVPIIRQLTEDGDFREPYLGVFAYDREVIPFIDGNFKLDSGIYVANVDKGGPAYKKGIKQGCIILKVDGQAVNTMMQLRTHMYSKKPGDTINITHLIDNGDVVTTPVKLSEKTKDGLVTR